jgi:hypothetical protein
MQGPLPTRSGRRVAFVSAAIIALIAAAAGVTVGLYQVAVSRASSALEDSHDAQIAEALISAFAQERLLMFRYIATGSPAVLNGVHAKHDQFAVLAGIGFALFTQRLLGRSVRREADLTAALDRLSDRDELLARLRSTSAVPAEVADEQRPPPRWRSAFRLMDVVLVCAGAYLSRIHQAERCSAACRNGHRGIGGRKRSPALVEPVPDDGGQGHCGLIH